MPDLSWRIRWKCVCWGTYAVDLFTNVMQRLFSVKTHCSQRGSEQPILFVVVRVFGNIIACCRPVTCHWQSLMFDACHFQRHPCLVFNVGHLEFMLRARCQSPSVAVMPDRCPVWGAGDTFLVSKTCIGQKKVWECKILEEIISRYGAANFSYLLHEMSGLVIFKHHLCMLLFSFWLDLLLQHGFMMAKTYRCVHLHIIVDNDFAMCS